MKTVNEKRKDQERKSREGFSMTQTQLKLLAIATMFIDHSGLLLFQGTPFYLPMRLMGRLAFPIFCFLLVEGFFHTRNVYHYMGRLFCFAMLSELPFDLMLYADEISFQTQSPDRIFRMFLGSQNVIWTLLLGLIILWICSHLQEKLLHIPVVIGGMLLAEIISSDYSYLGILIIYFFYLFPVGRGNDEYGDLTLQKVKLIICHGAVELLAGTVQAAAIVSLLPIFTYRGEKDRGKRHFWKNKYFFYVFYPVHMLLLTALHWAIFRDS